MLSGIFSIEQLLIVSLFKFFAILISSLTANIPVNLLYKFNNVITKLAILYLYKVFC